MSTPDSKNSVASDRVVSVSDPPKLEILSRGAVVEFVDQYRLHAGQVRELGLVPSQPQSFVKKRLVSSFEFVDKSAISAEADAFLDFLLKTFAHDASESVTLSRLEKVRMRFLSTGGLVEYASEIHEVIGNSKLDADSNVVRKVFRKNLHPAIRSECKTRLLVAPKDKFQDEFEVVNTVLKDYLSFKAQFAKSPGITSSYQEKPQQVSQSVKKDVSEKKFSRITPQEKENLVKLGGCTYCRVLDHSNSNCPKIAAKEAEAKVKSESKSYDLRSRTKTVSTITKEEDGLTFVKLIFNDAEHPCLLDSGSSVNLMDDSLIIDKNVIIPAENVELKSFNGQTTIVNRKIVVAVKDQDLVLEFFVCEQLTYPFILGSKDCRRVQTGGVLTLIPFLDEIAQVFDETADNDRSDDNTDKLLLPEFSIQLLPGATPPPFRARRMHPKAISFLKDEVDRLLKKGVIRKSSCEPGTWISHPLVVPKKDGSLRKVVDYRQLNEVTVPFLYPMPIIDELFQRCRNSKYFSKLDLKSAYWQVPVAESSKKLLAFAVDGEVFEYEKCSMGPRNVPAFFNGAVMADVLKEEIRDGICLQYFDDVLVLGATVNENIENLTRVAEKLCRYGFRVGLEKCEFLLQEIEYLGFLVNDKGRRINPERFQGLQGLRPKTKRQLQGILGLLNYYRDFVENYAGLSTSLYHKVQEKRFTWTEEDQAALMLVVHAIVDSPSIPFVDFSKPFLLRTDASDVAVGGILYQDDIPVAICSSSLKGAQRRWITQEKELWAILCSVRKWRHWLQFSSFVIVTDNRNVLYLQSSTSPKVQRWHSELQQYDYSLRWASGDSNVHADTLSRASVDRVGSELVNVSIWKQKRRMRFTPKKVELNRTEKACISSSETELSENEVSEEEPDEAKLEEIDPLDSASLTTIVKQSQKVYDTEGVKDENGIIRTSEDGRVCIPSEDRQLIRTLLLLAHEEYGHVGREKMDRLLENFAWKGKSKDIKMHLRSCFKCTKSKSPFVMTGELHPWIAQKPFSVWHIDHQGPFRVSLRSNKYILCCVDRFSKLTVLVPVDAVTASTTANALISSVFAYFGVPDLIISDRGAAFTSEIWKQVCLAFHVPFHLTTAYHHQSNGQVERVNRFVLAILRTLLCSSFKNWDIQLPFIQSVINSTVSSSTQFSPAEIVFGNRMPSLLNQFDASALHSSSLSEYVDQLKKQISKIREKALENMKKYNLEMKQQYEKGKKKLDLSIGDYVLFRELRNHKLQDLTGGPAEVLELLPNGKIRVFDMATKNIFIVNESEIVEIDRSRVSVQELMDESYMEALKKFE
ncbi:MAG: RNase H-like domain-containing protein [Candidatus Thorarchaeota archaeon]|nr:RNase H-like domain-containing protein [Candidatus Thorarchaeota archaeon]